MACEAPAKMILFAVLAAGSFLFAQEVIPVHPQSESGQSITAAYEGWFKNPDGTFSILFGYFNRNTKQELDISVGPQNNIEPGGPDRGQPTHFLPQRQWGVFTVVVPADFGSKSLTWTIIANGQQTKIPAKLDPLWEVAPFLDATNNTPPYIGFSAIGPFVQGPRGQSKTMTAKAGSPVALDLWVADDAKVVPGATRPRTSPVLLTWSKFRGPGAVTFENARPAAQEAAFTSPPNATFTGKASTTATFSQPGEYVLRVAANDYSGEGGRGFQCCWSNAQIKISVTP